MQLCVGDNAPSACAAAWVVMGRHQKALPGTALSRRVRSFSARSITCDAYNFNSIQNRCKCKAIWHLVTFVRVGRARTQRDHVSDGDNARSPTALAVLL
jgi:hypothetical protein